MLDDGQTRTPTVPLEAASPLAARNHKPRQAVVEVFLHLVGELIAGEMQGADRTVSSRAGFQTVVCWFDHHPGSLIAVLKLRCWPTHDRCFICVLDAVSRTLWTAA